MARNITRGDHETKIGEQEPILGYEVTRGSMRIVELENRCAGNRTVGSNPTLSASTQESQRLSDVR
jgi:hypothetical protein